MRRNKMRKVILSVLFAIVIVLAKVEVYAQTSLPKETTCQPSADEILLVIKSVYNLSPNAETLLIAGETRTTQLRISDLPVSLTRATAAVGGTFKTANHPFYLIRQSAQEQTKTILQFDL